MKLTLGNAMIKAYTNDRQENAADDVIAMIQNLPEDYWSGARRIRRSKSTRCIRCVDRRFKGTGI